MIKKVLYEMAELLNCSYEIGIWSEINSFLEYEEDKILNSKLKFIDDQNLYCLWIRLKDMTNDGVEEIFKKLVRFIEYSKATFYIKEEQGDDIVYYLVSATKEDKGLFIKMIFTYKNDF